MPKRCGISPYHVWWCDVFCDAVTSVHVQADEISQAPSIPEPSAAGVQSEPRYTPSTVAQPAVSQPSVSPRLEQVACSLIPRVTHSLSLKDAIETDNVLSRYPYDCTEQ